MRATSLLDSIRFFRQSPNWGRFLALMFMGVPVGLVFVFILNTLQFWLNSYNLSKATIGIFSFAILPNALKFLWAPFIELIKFPLFSRFLPDRYAWSVGLCFLHCLLLPLIALQTPSEDFLSLFLLVMVCSLATASLEINLDAIRIELLPKKHQGYATSFYSLGYRFGTILGAMGVLYVSVYFGWSSAFAFVVIVLGMSGVFLAVCSYIFGGDETRKLPNALSVAAGTPKISGLRQLSKKRIFQLLERFRQPFITFTQSKNWLAVFLFIFTFRLGDNFINNMSNIFYLSLGFTELDIANVVKFFGVFLTILGTFLGGYMVVHRGDLTALLMSGCLHTMSNFMYIVMAYVGHNEPLFYTSVALENVTGGMATTAFVAFLSNLCKRPHTASHYALFSSIWYLCTACSGFGGILASVVSWPTFFMIAIAIGTIPLGLIAYMRRYPLGGVFQA